MERLNIPTSVILQALDKVIELLVAEYDNLGLRDSGNWARQLEGVVENDKGVIKGAPYTEQLVQGRKPGIGPPIGALDDWIKRKLGVTDEKKIKSLAYVIGRNIAQNGTTIYQDGGTDLVEILESPKVNKIFTDLIGDYIRVTISKELIRDFKTLE